MRARFWRSSSRSPTYFLVRAGAVGEQVELLLLDAVLHVPARAVQLLVQAPGGRRTTTDPGASHMEEPKCLGL